MMRGVRLAALSLSVASIASLATVAWYGYRETVQAELARVELMARVLEDHATRSVESVDLIFCCWSVSHPIQSDQSHLNDDDRATMESSHDRAVVARDHRAVITITAASAHRC